MQTRQNCCHDPEHSFPAFVHCGQQSSLGLIDELSMEVRTISHLLHPPLLDEVGLSSALRIYLDGFADRSKIRVDLEIPDDFGRLSQELETAIFRKPCG